MCGIAGFQGRFDSKLLGRMANALAHRGPDDVGEWHSPESGIGLAHRRLAIIDLSPLGHQPMHDALGTVVIVFNGEIYNFRELRQLFCNGSLRSGIPSKKDDASRPPFLE